MQFFKENKNILWLCFSAIIFRIVISFFGTLHLDQGTFIAWSNILVRDGLKNFYNGWSDYLPGYLYFLWVLGKINLLGIVPQTLLYKLPAIFADALTGFLIYKIVNKSKGEKWGIIAALIYLFNPAVFANSALWGQVDSLTALTSVFSIYILPSNLILSAISLSVGTVIKPQTAFIFPVIVLLMVKNKWNWQKIFVYLIIGLLVFIGLFFPFWNQGNFIQFIFERLSISASQYPYTSVNAFNFWGLVGMWQRDNLIMQLGGYLFALVIASITFWKIFKDSNKQKNIEYFFMALIFALSFVFFTRMHERHLLPVFAPLAIAAIENPILMIPYIGFSVTYIANLYYSYIWINQNFSQVFSDFLIKFFDAANVGFAVFIFYSIIKNIKITWEKVSALFKKILQSDRKANEYKLPKIKLTNRKAKVILYTILAFAFVTRVFDLNSPPTMYFDEVYHAFTAKVIMSKDVTKAWEWWNTPPAGFAYEWTHPPLAKLGMVLGMSIFGQNSFGWRIPGALLGVGSVLLVYLLAKTIFNDEVVGLLSAGVFSLDGLPLVMSRIGMNDSYVLFFVLLSIYLFIKEQDFWSAIVFGLAIASKWSAIWALPIIGILWLQRNPLKTRSLKVIKTMFWFLLLPFAIYLLSYLDMFLTGHSVSTWWGMQEQMWWYHTGLKATHPYSSMWWSWPFLLRPIYLYTSDEVGGWVSRIYAFGNPAVFWFGSVSIIMSAIYTFMERNKKIGLIVFAYFISFLPWAISPRIMFLYHYLPAIPFMCIAIGYILRRYPKITFVYLFICLLIFIYFYPHYIGLKIPLWLDRSYYWFSSWR